jgi:hypothetical protein
MNYCLEFYNSCLLGRARGHASLHKSSGVLCSDLGKLLLVSRPPALAFRAGLVLDRLVLAFFLFACGARIFSANTTPASLLHLLRYMTSPEAKRKHMQLLISRLSAAACSPEAKGRRGGLAAVVGSSLVSSLVC